MVHELIGLVDNQADLKIGRFSKIKQSVFVRTNPAPSVQAMVHELIGLVDNRADLAKSDDVKDRTECYCSH
jgi:methyl coenzyme M reductase subunit D